MYKFQCGSSSQRVRGRAVLFYTVILGTGQQRCYYLQHVFQGLLDVKILLLEGERTQIPS